MARSERKQVPRWGPSASGSDEPPAPPAPPRPTVPARRHRFGAHPLVWVVSIGLPLVAVGLALGATPHDAGDMDSVTVDAIAFGGPFLAGFGALLLASIAAVTERAVGALSSASALGLVLLSGALTLLLWFALELLLLAVTQNDDQLYARVFNVMLIGVPGLAAGVATLGSTVAMVHREARRGPPRWGQ